MSHDEQLKKLLSRLNETAIKYNNMLNLTIVFESDQFKRQKIYKAKFYKGNFLHLTGVITNLKAVDFFNKCLEGKITKENILNFPDEYRSRIDKKLRNLSFIDEYFKKNLDVQEDFSRNSVNCAFATSDGYKTVGFVYTLPIIRPMTILDRNRLDINKPIYQIKPKIIHPNLPKKKI